VAGLGSHRAEGTALSVQSRWAKLWLGTFIATAFVLIAAAAVETPIVGWIAVALCIVFALVTLINHAVLGASDRSRVVRREAVIRAIRWLGVSAAGLTGALVVEATVSPTAGAALVALALLTLFGAFAAFYLRW
jgi:hypothetical protein